MSLFVDLWSAHQSGSSQRTGPLVPSVHQIRDPRRQYLVKQEISRLWKLPTTRAHNPCPNPVSLERKDMNTLIKNRYVVAEKTDGVRYLLLLMRWPKVLGGQPCAIMCSRKFDMYEIRVMAEEDYFQGTLIDGELVWEYEGGQFVPPRQVFLAFDLVAVRGISHVDQNFLKRYAIVSDILDCGGKDIIQDPRKWIETAQGLCENHKVVCEGNQYCLCFRPKRIWPKNEIGTVWRMRKSLRHKSDGLVLTPVDQPILTGTHDRIFKWKSQHTIDIVWRCRVNNDDEQATWDYEVMFLDAGKECLGDMEGVQLRRPSELDDTADEVYPFKEVPLVILPNAYSARIIHWHHQRGERSFEHIVECTCKLPSITDFLDRDEDNIPLVECSILKIRNDKATPNQKSTIEKTLCNIQENITIKDLLDVVSNDSIVVTNDSIIVTNENL